MEIMTNYKTLSRYYDVLMWNDHTDIYVKLIREFSGKSNDKQKLLDLWCGTWSLLKAIWSEYETYGIDLSGEIIEIAKDKDKQWKYMTGSILEFHLAQKFDIITCCFDTINHLDSKEKWRQAFRNIKNHLGESGVFLFDINTLEKFKHIHERNIVKHIGDDYAIIENISEWSNCTFFISIFMLQQHWNYKLYREEIREITFTKEEVISMLKEEFNSVEIVLNKNDRRLFFACSF